MINLAMGIAFGLLFAGKLSHEILVSWWTVMIPAFVALTNQLVTLALLSILKRRPNAED